MTTFDVEELERIALTVTVPAFSSKVKAEELNVTVGTPSSSIKVIMPVVNHSHFHS